MRYIFNEQNLQLNSNEVAVVFIDFTGNKQLAVMNTNETLPVLPLKQGTVPIISLQNKVAINTDIYIMSVFLFIQYYTFNLFSICNNICI